MATVGAQEALGRSFTGVVSARVQSDLGFRVPGKVIERLVDTGQAVRRGQPLMRIDRTDFTLATTARAGAVAAARATAIQTGADERRFRGLVATGAVSASAYDQVKAAADAARAQLDAASALDQVAGNEAGYSILRADADGVIVETLAEPGQVVAAGQPVVRLARSGPREATIDLPETVRPTLGSQVEARLFHSNVVGSARLRELSNAADPMTRTFRARYVLEGAAASAPLGATVSVELPAEAGPRAWQIPLAAIYDAGRGPGVWIVSGIDPVVSWRPVKVTSIGDETAVISGGIAPAERFVALGAHLLHQGQKVRVAVQEAASR